MKKIKISSIFCLISFFLLVSTGWCDLYINLLAVNPREDETKEADIKQYLPKDLQAEDILDSSGLQVEYDLEKKVYYVHGKITLSPKETRTVKIRVKDVWKVEQKEFDEAKVLIEASMNRLSGSEGYEKAVVLKEQLIKDLDILQARQKEQTGSVKKRIEEYQRSKDILLNIKRQAASVDYWKKEPRKEKGVVTQVIVVENPSDSDVRTVKHEHYLPKEILPEHIIDAQGFDVRYDDQKKLSFLTKEEEFQPGETKRYKIVMKDIWAIENNDIDQMRTQANEILTALESQPGFKENADYLVKNIEAALKQIEESQAVKKGVKNKISTFRENAKLFENVQDDMRILGQLQNESKKDLTLSRLENVLKKLKSLTGVSAISDALFKKSPTVNTAWKAIFAIVGFIAFFTILNFAVSAMRSGNKKDGGAKETEKPEESDGKKE